MISCACSWLLDQDVTRVVLRLRHGRDLRVVFRLQLGIGRLLVLQVVLGAGLLEDLQTRELQQRGGVAALVEAVLLGLLRDDFAAHQVVEQPAMR